MRPNGAFLGPAINDDGTTKPRYNSLVGVVRINMTDMMYTNQAGFGFLRASWVTEEGSLGSNVNGLAVSFTVEAEGASSYSLVSGSLPNGMSLNSSTGVISGTPNVSPADYSSNTFTFVVAAFAGAAASEREFSITITSRYVGQLCNTTGEGGTITLTAPTGMVINRKDFSHYGTYSGSCPTFTRGGCSSSGAANWNPSLPAASLSFVANNSTWGDPCSGTSKGGALVVSYGPY